MYSVENLQTSSNFPRMLTKISHLEGLSKGTKEDGKKKEKGSRREAESI